MATDPITGLSLDDQSAQQALDYLGRPAPLGLAQQTALPGAQGASPSAGPASMGGSGAAAPSAAPAAGGQSVGAGFGQNTFGPSVPGLATQLGAAGAGAILGQGKGQLKNLLPDTSGPLSSGVLGSGGNLLGPGAEFVGAVPAEDLFAGGAGALYGESASGLSGGLGEGVGSLGASAGELGAGSLLGAYGGLSAAYDLGKLALKLAGIKGGPTTGNTWADLGLSLLGGPIADPAKELVGSFLGPSSSWQSFGSRLGGTLGGESSAINTLVPWLGKAQTRGDIDQSLDLFRQLVETGAGVGGYQLGGRTASGAPQVGLLPGAFGTKHEGGLTADFGPVTSALNDYISKLYDVLPEGAASSPLSYEAYAAGMGQPEYDQMQGLVQQVVGMAPDQAQAFVAQSGLDPAMQQKILDVAATQASMTPGVERGGPDPYQESLRLAGMGQ